MAERTTSASSRSATREVSFEEFVTGRLTLVGLRLDLQTRIAGLRSQLAIAESQLRQTEDLLRRADEKMARQHPEALAFLAGPS